MIFYYFQFYRHALLGLAVLAPLGLVSAQQLSPLAPEPAWSSLAPYQETITRAEFTRLIDQVYAPSGSFWPFTTVNDTALKLFSDPAHRHPLFTLKFAASEAKAKPVPIRYQTKAPGKDPARPLAGLRIALDPGHIGGEWARLEGRYFKLGDDPPIEEARLNLITCELLADRLHAQGAEIIWAKRGYEPVTNLRPDSLHREAIAALALAPETAGRKTSAGIRRLIDGRAALLFYRVAEIRARAEIVNRQQPDLTICIHYNADEWGNPDRPSLIGRSRLIIFMNGAYGRGELIADDGKFDLLRKLLDRTAEPEARGCALVGRAMLDLFRYPPEHYLGSFVQRQTDVPSVYARNLLANRLYHGPVIYCEGPFMNARDAYPRLIAGDYLGQRLIAGQNVPSIYADYARSVEAGVLKYFGGGEK